MWRYEANGRRMSRVIGMVVDDYVTEWQCPDCGSSWERNAVEES